MIDRQLVIEIKAVEHLLPIHTAQMLTYLLFTDETKAREHLEAIRWPDGPYCPHCGETQRVYRLNGKSHRPGLLHCNGCNEAFRHHYRR